MPASAIQIDAQLEPGSSRARIYTVIALIPQGQVASYGQIAALAGLQGQARQIGYALAALPEGNSVPWHRVVNARGEISLRSRRESIARQRALLEGEGVLFDASGRVDLRRFQWRP
jgi:methylated-DNA-protein-cysteine methyltransferase-like protein